MEIIIGRKGTQKTQITDPTVSREHCKVTVNGDGTFTIENLSQSGTKVDGRDIIRSTVTQDSVIQLGQSFKATLRELIGNVSTSSKITPQQSATAAKEVPTFCINHLRDIWNAYDDANTELAEKNRSMNLIRTAAPIFTIGAAAVSKFFPYAWILTGFGVMATGYGFLGMKNSETPKQRKERQEEFEEKWICPNPKCGKYLPKVSYKQLIRNYSFTCPYCKCKYVEK